MAVGQHFSGPGSTAHQLWELGGGGPVPVAHAYAAGISRSALRHAVATGVVVAVAHGVVAPAAYTDESLLARHERLLAAHVRANREAVVGGVSAAALHELSIPWPLPDPRRDVATAAHLIAPDARPRPDRVVRRGLVPLSERVEIRGLPVTDVWTTALDVATGLPLHLALVILDSAVRQSIATSVGALISDPAVTREVASAAARRAAADHLTSLAGTRRCSRGVKDLRYAVALVDPRAESPLESESRGLFIFAGLAPDDVQVEVRGVSGRVYRADMGWRGRILGEADGWVKYASSMDLRREKQREDDLREAGFRVVRWTSDEVRQNPSLVVDRVGRAISLAA